MLMHPELMMNLADERRRELIAEADRERLLAAAQTARRARRGRKSEAVRGQPTGNLASCESSVAVPVR
ncbi:hypothetical protein [Actinoplanes sp. HUAS TT8]|uniref:hypothetical protein n=1 Tax=Actinoplanes sp. HUAS TT8 TaxID=3447453 RepID=UPI003F51E975